MFLEVTQSLAYQFASICEKEYLFSPICSHQNSNQCYSSSCFASTSRHHKQKTSPTLFDSFCNPLDGLDLIQAIDNSFIVTQVTQAFPISPLVIKTEQVIEGEEPADLS